MERYTIQQHIFVIDRYFKNNENFAAGDEAHFHLDNFINRQNCRV